MTISVPQGYLFQYKLKLAHKYVRLAHKYALYLGFSRVGDDKYFSTQTVA